MKGLKMKNSPSKPIWLHDGQSGCKTAMIGMDFIVFHIFLHVALIKVLEMLGRYRLIVPLKMGYIPA